MRLKPTVLKKAREAREAQAAQAAQAPAHAAAAATTANAPNNARSAPPDPTTPTPPPPPPDQVPSPSPAPQAIAIANTLPCPALYAPIHRVSYTPKLAEEICDLVSGGHTLTAICSRPDMPSLRSVSRWIRKYETFRRQYVEAQRFARQRLNDQILLIIDDLSRDIVTLKDSTGKTREVLNPVAVQRARAQVQARQRMIEHHKIRRTDRLYDEFGNPVDIAAAAPPPRPALPPAPSKPERAGYVLTEEEREQMMADWKAINDENLREAEKEKNAQPRIRDESVDPPQDPGPAA